MGHWVPEFSKKKTILISSLVGLSAFLIMAFIIQNDHNQKLQDEMLETTERYMVFQTDLENKIYTNIYLINGYVAYLKAECELDWRRSTEYLSILFEGQDVYITNIGTIIDTTIISKFPLEGNENTIGIDLAMLESRKEMVLRTKNELIATFQGPLSLMQGGTGFVVRVPVVREDSGYWGQVSIVLDDERIYEVIDRLAEKSALNIRIYNSETYIYTPFYMNEEKMMKDPLVFVISPNLMNWTVEVTPIHGWYPYGISHIFTGFLCALASIIIGLLSYYLMKANYKFKHNSIHDSLTGLLNRHFLNDYQKLIVSAAVRKNAMVGLLILDLDNFKNINDTYGHSIGDEVLIEAARILKKVVRTNEAVFRIGGDEFLVIFPMIEDEEVLKIAAKRIVDMFDNEFKVKSHDIVVTSSIGMGVYPTDGKTFEEVMIVADKKMYKQKQSKSES